jgi:hypothetical protein
MDHSANAGHWPFFLLVELKKCAQLPMPFGRLPRKKIYCGSWLSKMDGVQNSANLTDFPFSQSANVPNGHQCPGNSGELIILFNPATFLLFIQKSLKGTATSSIFL